jgi:TolB protein
MRMRHGWVVLLLLLGQAMVCEASDIVVSKTGTSTKSSLDISGLKASGPAGAVFVQTLESDLKRSGWFTVTRAGGGVLVSGSCGESGSDVVAQCDVRTSGSPQSLLQKRYVEASAQARRAAHKAADDIVFALKGVRGMAATRIAMIGARGGRKDLYICAADGANLTQITRDGVPCLAPSWGPDGSFLTYTSFRSGYPDVYRIDLSTLRRSRIAGFPGLNSGADVSPTGNRVALTLSKDGNPDLYILGAAGGVLARLTSTSHAAEASPSWSPDGNRIVYVSDRAHSPQLYVISASGGSEQRISVQGTENVAPDWGPDGRIVYSSKRGGIYQLCIADLSSGTTTQCTADAADHEDPSWAPDGRHLVYTRTSGYHKSLSILDTLGDPEVRLISVDGDWSSPAWSWR